jgi:dethiobiotin synthetase
VTAPALRSFIVQATEPGAGQTLVVTALVKAFLALGVNALAMKPLARGVVDPGGRWVSDELQRLAAVSAFGLPARALCTHLLTDVVRTDTVGNYALSPEPTAPLPTLESVIDTFNVLSTWADVVVVDCADACAVELQLDFGSQQLASRLHLPFVQVVNLGPDYVAQALRQRRALLEQGLECVAWVVNQAAASDEQDGQWLRELVRALPGPCLGAIPQLQPLSSERAAEAIDMQRLLAALD